MDETEGMTEREKVMWGLLVNVIELLERSTESAHDRYMLNSYLHNAKVEMAEIWRSEHASDKLPSNG